MPQVLTTPGSEPSTSEVTQAEAAAMIRTVFNLFRLWKVTDAQARVLLGQPSPSTFYRWKRGEIGSMPADTIWRLGDLMGIHKALRHLFTEPERGYAWVSRPNAAFGGKSALERMLAGAPSDLTAVRNYLDAERGGW
ncbi:MAG: MbcA/ParS/Xre antitoxin family protein [Hyphomicrobium sp.]